MLFFKVFFNVGTLKRCSFILFVINSFINNVTIQSCFIFFYLNKISQFLSVFVQMTSSFLSVCMISSIDRQNRSFTSSCCSSKSENKKKEQAGFEPGPPGHRANVLPLDHGALLQVEVPWHYLGLVLSTKSSKKIPRKF